MTRADTDPGRSEASAAGSVARSPRGVRAVLVVMGLAVVAAAVLIALAVLQPGRGGTAGPDARAASTTGDVDAAAVGTAPGGAVTDGAAAGGADGTGTSAGTAASDGGGDPDADAPGAGTGTSIIGLADPGWVQETSAATGIPERAMSAYAGAALQVAGTDPSCGIGWNTLAGIGEVESGHGTIHGSTIEPDGRARPELVGIPLDGHGVARISDSDEGQIDGDDTWDRAIGPLQFLPSTWERWGTDGNGDGTADPHQIDDAALSAARYLCATGGDMTVSSNWIRAVASYNQSVDYNNRVARAADEYARAAQG